MSNTSKNDGAEMVDKPHCVTANKGIGYEIAKIFAAEDVTCILTARSGMQDEMRVVNQHLCVPPLCTDILSNISCIVRFANTSNAP